MDASDIDVDNIYIPGVDVAIQEPKVIDIVDPAITPTDPSPIELDTVHRIAEVVELMPSIQHVEPKLCRLSIAST